MFNNCKLNASMLLASNPDISFFYEKILLYIRIIVAHPFFIY
jgi:hypothetical protein